MPIKSGRYIITHAQHWNLAFLSDANDGTSLLGCLEQDVPGEEWNVKELQNGRYSIANFGHKMSASTVFQAQKGEHVVGRERGSVWLIKEHGSEGKYTIATANDKLRWWLDDSWPETPITLHDAPPSDPRCQWTFQKISRLNVTPFGAATEEVTTLKAELTRKTTEVEVAKQEAAQSNADASRKVEELKAAKKEVKKAEEEVRIHKSSFRSYFTEVSELDIDIYAVTNFSNDEKWRPIQVSLFWAAEKGNDTAAQIILAQKGVDVNSTTNDGSTSLLIAAYNGHDAVVRLLLAQEGVDINSADMQGWTPLMTASYRGHDTVVQLLLEQEGVDVNVRDEDGKTPLMWAEEKKHKTVARLLRERTGTLAVHLSGVDQILESIYTR